MSEYEPLIVNVPEEQAKRVQAELVKRLGLNPDQIVAGSLVLHWDSLAASVEWRGLVTLSADDAAEILAASLDPTS